METHGLEGGVLVETNTTHGGTGKACVIVEHADGTATRGGGGGVDEFGDGVGRDEASVRPELDRMQLVGKGVPEVDENVRATRGTVDDDVDESGEGPATYVCDGQRRDVSQTEGGESREMDGESGSKDLLGPACEGEIAEGRGTGEDVDEGVDPAGECSVVAVPPVEASEGGEERDGAGRTVERQRGVAAGVRTDEGVERGTAGEDAEGGAGSVRGVGRGLGVRQLDTADPSAWVVVRRATEDRAGGGRVRAQVLEQQGPGQRAPETTDLDQRSPRAQGRREAIEVEGALLKGSVETLQVVGVVGSGGQPEDGQPEFRRERGHDAGERKRFDYNESNHIAKSNKQSDKI